MRNAKFFVMLMKLQRIRLELGQVCLSHLRAPALCIAQAGLGVYHRTFHAGVIYSNDKLGVRF